MLIAGLDDRHRTEVTLRNVIIQGIQTSQVHLFYADITVLPPLPNIPFAEVARENKTVSVSEGAINNLAPSSKHPDPCEGKFVPMQ